MYLLKMYRAMPTPKYGEFGELMWKNSPNQCPDAVFGMGNIPH